MTSFNDFYFDDEDSSLVNIEDNIDMDNHFSVGVRDLDAQGFSNPLRMGVDTLRDASSAFFLGANQGDEYECADGNPRKRRRKITPDELREKNRIYAKNHRAEKKRRQEELLKRNEALEKENRHLKRVLVQMGFYPNGSGFNPAQTIKSVGNSLVKGVRGGIGFMRPSGKTPVEATPDPTLLDNSLGSTLLSEQMSQLLLNSNYIPSGPSGNGAPANSWPHLQNFQSQQQFGIAPNNQEK